jgi:hypothetical protein
MFYSIHIDFGLTSDGSQFLSIFSLFTKGTEGLNFIKLLNNNNNSYSGLISINSSKSYINHMFHSIHMIFGLTSDGTNFCPISHFSLKALKGSIALSYKTTTMVVIVVSYQLVIACQTIFAHIISPKYL